MANGFTGLWKSTSSPLFVELMRSVLQGPAQGEHACSEQSKWLPSHPVGGKREKSWSLKMYQYPAETFFQSGREERL